MFGWFSELGVLQQWSILVVLRGIIDVNQISIKIWATVSISQHWPLPKLFVIAIHFFFFKCVSVTAMTGVHWFSKCTQFTAVTRVHVLIHSHTVLLLLFVSQQHPFMLLLTQGGTVIVIPFQASSLSVHKQETSIMLVCITHFLLVVDPLSLFLLNQISIDLLLHFLFLCSSPFHQARKINKGHTELCRNVRGAHLLEKQSIRNCWVWLPFLLLVFPTASVLPQSSFRFYSRNTVHMWNQSTSQHLSEV